MNTNNGISDNLEISNNFPDEFKEKVRRTQSNFEERDRERAEANTKATASEAYSYNQIQTPASRQTPEQTYKEPPAEYEEIENYNNLNGRGYREIPNKEPTAETETKDEAPEQTPRSIKLYTYAETVKYAETLPPIKRIFGDYIADNQLIMFFSRAGVGKSLFLTELCSQVSQGSPFLEQENDFIGGLKCLYVDFDNPVRQFQRRQFKTNPNDNFIYYNPEAQEPEAARLDNLLSIENALKTIRPKLLILDTLKHISISEENRRIDFADAKFSLEYFKILQNLCRTYETTIICVMHSIKSQLAYEPLSLQFLQGSFEAQGIADHIIGMNFSQQNPAQRYVKCLKNRISPHKPEVLAYEIMTDDDDGKISQRFCEFGNEADYIKRPANDKDEKIINNIFETDKPLQYKEFYTEIAKQFDICEQAAKNKITKLKNKGLIEQKNGFWTLSEKKDGMNTVPN